MEPAMSVDAFLKRLRESPDDIEFADTIAVIDAHYDYTPTAFRNGDVHNEAGQNAGSCKLLSFAQMQGLSEAETLACFGSFYRDDVLKNPDGSDHQNIRNFMRTGWGGVVLERPALAAR
jgi:hypothetical protein